MKEDNIIIRKENDDDGLDNFNYVKATKYGDNLDLMACTNSFKKGNQKPNCKKICKGMYINTVTNEYIKAKEHINRGENFRLLKSLRTTCINLFTQIFIKILVIIVF